MKKCHPLLTIELLMVMVMFFFGGGLGGWQAKADTGIFSLPAGQISDDMTRLTLARLLSFDHDRLREASAKYRLYLNNQANDINARLEWVRVLTRQDLLDEASQQIAICLTQTTGKAHEDNLSAILVELGHLEASLGHVEKSQTAYKKALEITDNNDKVLLSYADQMNRWGDFNRIEAIYRDYLSRFPNNREMDIKLANVLASAQRFAEAEGIYQRLLDENVVPKEAVLLGLANVRLQENNLTGTLAVIDDLLGDQTAEETVGNKLNNLTKIVNKTQLAAKLDPIAETNSDAATLVAGLRLKGETLFRLQQYAAALKIYSLLADSGLDLITGLKGQARVYFKLKDKEKATAYYAHLLKVAPDNLEARFFLALSAHDEPGVFLESLLQAKSTSAMTLVDVGQRYGGQEMYGLAVESFRAAIKKDPHCFPARLGLIEGLAANHQFDLAIDLLGESREKFPENRKLNLTFARILSWSKQYEEAIQAYDEAIGLQPLDPVPQIEKARTAFWGKMIDEAQSFYGALWLEPVDQKLVKRLSLTGLLSLDIINELLKDFDEQHGADEQREQLRPYQQYEMFIAAQPTLLTSLPLAQVKLLNQILLALYPSYKIQKSAYLESLAKGLAWNKKYTQAKKAFDELLVFQPGNQEALFDDAQVECSLGLCDKEKSSYEKLLRISPWHSLAKTALKRQANRRHPSIELRHNFWKESGRGELARISRQRTDLALDLPLYCRYHLRFIGHQWRESPHDADTHYTANGHTVELTGVITPYLSGGLAWTQKNYHLDGIPDRRTGYGQLNVNLWDAATLAIGFDRTDVLANPFGIKQGTQSDTHWLGLTSDITRKLQVKGRARLIDYNDDNKGRHHSLAAAYALTDHPRSLKVILAGEYRDTDRMNIFNYQQELLTDIIYPYWTPQNYIGGGLTLQWRHDLSSLFFCGAEQHYYDINLSFGSNSEDNPSAQLELEWHYEFKQHWRVNIKGLIHESNDWDGNGLWLGLRYRF